MNLLVTGGTGFIGGALVKTLLKNGHCVILLTRDKKRAEMFASHPQIYIQEYSSNSYGDLSKILNSVPCRVQGIFHLAANMKYLGKRNLLFRDNVVYTQNLLEWSSVNNVKFLLFASSIDAMGPTHSDKIPLTEEQFCHPLSTYGWSKYEAEKIVSGFGKQTNLKTVSLRLGNVYGPGNNFIVVDIARAIQQGASNPLIKYYHQIKDCIVHLCYVDDIVQGICQSAFTHYRSGDVFILSGDEPTTIGTLFDYISEALKQNFDPPKYKPSYDLMIKVRKLYYLKIKKKADRVTYFQLGNWFASTDKAKDVLNYQPNVSLREGIPKTLQWENQQGMLKNQ